MLEKNKSNLIPLDPEIDRTLRKLRRRRRIEENIEEEIMAEIPIVNNDGRARIEQEEVPRRRTIRELTQSDANFEQLHGAIPNFTVDFEIKGHLIHSLPKFHGLAGENPYVHLNTLHMHCMTMKPVGAKIEEVMWKVFHLTLEGKAKEWYMMLPIYVENAYQSWENLRRAFLEKYFPSNWAATARKEIPSARQDGVETFFEYWSRF